MDCVDVSVESLGVKNGVERVTAIYELISTERNIAVPNSSFGIMFESSQINDIETLAVGLLTVVNTPFLSL